MTSGIDYSNLATEHTRVVEFVLNCLRDYKNKPDILRSDPELLLEEVVASIKRYYRITAFEIVDVPDGIRFALDRDVDLHKVVEALGLTTELKECAFRYLDLLERPGIDDDLKPRIDGFMTECERNLNSEESLYQVSMASGITISSAEVFTKLRADHKLASELGLGTIEKMAFKDVNFGKVAGCDAVGFWLGGPKGAAGASAISIIMQLP